VSLRHLVRTFFIIIAVPILAFAQDAQRMRDRDPDLAGAKKVASDLQQANFHSGPFYLFSRLRIGDAGYSEDYYVPTSDSTGGVSLTVEAPNRLYFVPQRKIVLSAEVIPGYSFLSSGDKRGQFNYAARGDAHFLLNHLYLDLYTAQSDQLRAHVADVNTLATLKSRETGLSGEAKYSSRTSGIFTVRYIDDKYPPNRLQPADPARDVSLLNRTEKNARVSLVHKTFPLTSFFLAAEGSEYDFSRATYKNSQRLYTSAGLLYDRGRTSMRLEAGPARLRFDDPTQRDYQGIQGAFAATRGNGRWTYSLNANRDLGFAIFVDNNYFVADTAQVGVDYIASRRLSLRANSAYEHDRFDTPVLGRLRRDTVTFNSVGFLYTLRRIRAGIDVGYYERTTTAFGDEDSGIRYVLHLSFTP